MANSSGLISRVFRRIKNESYSRKNHTVKNNVESIAVLLDRLIVNHKYEKRSFVGSGTTAGFSLVSRVRRNARFLASWHERSVFRIPGSNTFQGRCFRENLMGCSNISGTRMSCDGTAWAASAEAITMRHRKPAGVVFYITDLFRGR